MRKSKYNDETRQLAILLRRKGLTFEDVSKETSIPVSTIASWINKGKSDVIPRNPWVPKELELLSDLYPTSPKEDIVAKIPNHNWASIRQKAEKVGLRRDIYKKCCLDFSVMDTEEKAYIVGFIAADGCIREASGGYLSMRLMLALQDIKHLEILRDIICPEASIWQYKAAKPSHQDGIALSIFDTQMCKDLALWGITPRKAKTLKPPQNLSLDLVHHFIRGLFDGDGSFWIGEATKLRAEIWGTEEMMSWINVHFYSFYPHKCKISENRGSYRARYGGSTAKEFAKYLYKNATLYMERKYSKVKEFM